MINVNKIRLEHDAKAIAQRSLQLVSWINNPTVCDAVKEKSSQEYLDLLDQRNQVIKGVRKRLREVMDKRHSLDCELHHIESRSLGPKVQYFVKSQRLEDLQEEISALNKLLPVEQREPVFLDNEVPS